MTEAETIAKQTGYRTDKPLQMTTALRTLGVPSSRILFMESRPTTNAGWKLKRKAMGGSLCAAHFWGRREWDIADVLKLASRCHRERIKRIHTDKGGTSDEAVAHLKAWAFVKRHATKRGYGEYL